MVWVEVEEITWAPVFPGAPRALRRRAGRLLLAGLEGEAAWAERSTEPGPPAALIRPSARVPVRARQHAALRTSLPPAPSVPNAHCLHRPLPEEEPEREPGEVRSELPAKGPALLLRVGKDM